MTTIATRFERTLPQAREDLPLEPNWGDGRVAWNAADVQARRWYVDKCNALGLESEMDKNGNL